MTSPSAVPRLLAIDDDADSAELVARVAARAGFEADWIADPRLAAETVSRVGPNVVTLDLCMPDLDALDVLGELREAGFDGAILIVSGQPDSIRNAAARLAEANGHEVAGNFRKPVDVAAMRKRLFDIAAARAGDGAKSAG
ncbi:MAG: hypothetical protein TEF_03540 [Rhizobiales bacterium NRL2]|jgi:DNA-binding response OmpR family regulator|nr:MAG: hypothetical protein TEF_03540 [Rhizobiales bacterium NRL2]